MNSLKTLLDWNNSNMNLTDFCRPGDSVDDEMVDYFIGVVPPKTASSNCIQIGEVYDHEDGKERFMTIENLCGQWTYTGIKTAQFVPKAETA